MIRHVGAIGLLSAALGLGLTQAPLGIDGKIRLPKVAIKNREYPVMNLPLPMREENYKGGSCVHASWVMLLRWQRQYAYADYWRKKYAYGEYYAEMAQRLDAEGIKWAGTYQDRDVAFLEWACRTRRGCMVTCMNGAHMICLVDLNKTHATILDNNEIGVYRKIPRNEFLREWYNSGSWAMTPIYIPAPPLEKKA